MGRIIKKLNPKQDSGVQLHTQAGSITTNLKARIEFFLHKISEKKIMTDLISPRLALNSSTHKAEPPSESGSHDADITE